MSIARKIAELQEAFKEEYGLEVDLTVHVHSHRNTTSFDMAEKTLSDIVSNGLSGEINHHESSSEWGDTYWHRLATKDVTICIFYDKK